MTITRVALPIAAEQLFDYWLPAGVDAPDGSIVRVRLGHRRLAGVVVAHAIGSEVEQSRLLPVEAVEPLHPLPADLLELASFVSRYYQAALGMVLALLVPPLGAGAAARRSDDVAVRFTEPGRTQLPARLRSAQAIALHQRIVQLDSISPIVLATFDEAERRFFRSWVKAGWLAPAAVPVDAPTRVALNAAQAQALDAILSARGFAPMLLHGVTGSGKTAVYLAAAERFVADGGQVLLLVPEINLTPQFEARVRAMLPGASAVSLHSGLADGERRAAWEAAASGRAAIVLGTRLAVFAPLPKLALIVVDEEHDGSFKQQDGVRYHARDVALFRGRQRGVPVVLGSATPSLESWAHARGGRYRMLALPERADPQSRMPDVRFVDDREGRKREGLSDATLQALSACVARGEQALVFINRRGYAPSYKCWSCGWDAQCPRCAVRLTVHRDARQLRCHHCGHAQRLPGACPECGNVDLLPQGFGTQRLERALASALPTARIARVDRDTVRARGAFADVRDRFEGGAIDILVGTQMLAKGHDFPRLTLVVVLGADNALYSADFRATERVFALLMQVIGRAGRAGLPGEAILQTDFPHHPAYRAAARHDYATLANTLLEERNDARLPPATHVALLEAQAHDRAHVDAFLASARDCAMQCRAGCEVEIFAPVPALMAKRAGFERGQMLVQANRRPELQRFLPAWRAQLATRSSSRVRWAIDVDPASF